jgi:hypothetical protein
MQVLQGLLQSLIMQERSLAFDFSAIMLNETLDDPMSTNIPISWRPIVEAGENLPDLFNLLRVANFP